MSLFDLVDNTKTDKNTDHCYLGIYDKLLYPHKYTANRVLEVGIQRGGSIKLWRDYFVNAQIYGVDIMSYEEVWNDIKKDDRIILYTSVNAYDHTFVTKHLYDQKLQFDFILEDGPHTLDSMKSFIKLYLPILSETGILIIEDVQDISWIDELRSVVDDKDQPFVNYYDMRKIHNKYDDIIFVINRFKYVKR